MKAGVTTAGRQSEDARIMLGLLESVGQDGTRSQRSLAGEIGIALGLVNAYMKRCVKKGLVKVHAAPARRYSYYLTPQGFAEKSRLTVEYLSYSLSFFRNARSDCMDAFVKAQQRGWRRILLVGLSDLAEISTICAFESGATILGVVGDQAERTSFLGLPVFDSFDAVSEPFDGIMITDLVTAGISYERAVEHVGAERVLAPALLGLSTFAERKDGP
jgi:DNA-binding MarR family transcriptional regulator